jgi:hypothetical protein
MPTGVLMPAVALGLAATFHGTTATDGVGLASAEGSTGRFKTRPGEHAMTAAVTR